MQAMPASSPVTPSPVSSLASAGAVEAGDTLIAIDGEITEQPSFDQVLAAQVLDTETQLVPRTDEPSANPAAQPLPEILMAQLAAEIGLSPPGLSQGQAALIADVKNFIAPSGQVGSHELAIDEVGAGEGRSRTVQPPLADSSITDELIGASGVRSERNPLKLVQPIAGAELPGTDIVAPTTGSATLSAEVQKSAGVSRPQEAFNPRHIPEPVKTPAWGEALGQRILWMAKENVHVVHLQLEPPNLGPVEVELVLSRDQASLVFASPHAAVREAISESLSKLDNSLSSGGLSLGGVSVNSQSQSHQHARSGGRSGEPAGDWFTTHAVSEVPQPRVRVNIGLVDTFA